MQFIYLFYYFWQYWVFVVVHRLFVAVASSVAECELYLGHVSFSSSGVWI